jgi:hypothetical protein
MLTVRARRAGAAMLAGAVAMLAVSCRLDTSGPTQPRARPSIASALVNDNVHNALSAVVRFTAHNADSARVACRTTSSGGAVDASSVIWTPYVRLTGDSGTIPVLGLRANTNYALTLEVVGADIDTTALSFQSGALPDPLVGLELRQTGSPSPGYTLTDFTSAAAAYMVAFDTSGALVWYRGFATQPGEGALDAEQQSNGDYILFVGASTGWQPTTGRYYEVSAAGDSVRTFATTAPYYTDPHELRLDFNGDTLVRSHMLGYDIRHVDLTSLGGLADQQVAGHVIVRRSASGTVEFLWNAWDHFTIADWIFIQPGLANFPSIDFDHPNSIDQDATGNYIVSFANLGEITNIDAATGAMLWRFGGRHNQFTFVGDSLNGFGIQHDVRQLPNGDLLLMDNGLGHRPPESRAVEYRLDLAAHTATLVWQYRHSPAVFAPFAGSVQRLRSGSTVVAFGAAAHVVEVTPTGGAVWEADLLSHGQRVPYLYRARRIASLYRFGVL